VSDEGPADSGTSLPAFDGPETNLTAARFRKGTSGNPGGRPKDLPRFRKACRERGWRWLEEMDALMADPDVHAAIKLDIWNAVCDRGGLLTGKDQGAVDVASARLLILAAAIKDLPEQKRADILAMLSGARKAEPPAP
jgi:uncharacterized protein DUF5681